MASSTGPARGGVDVLVATFNSAPTLEECLRSVRENVPVNRLIVVDRFSSDATVEIARRYGAELHQEEAGIGAARTRLLELAETERVLFVDSDVILRRSDFLERAEAILRRPGYVAVVGEAVGHRFFYGLPMGLTLFPRDWARSVKVQPEVQGYEGYEFRRRIRRERLKVGYLADSMAHRPSYRGGRWPEWQGAQLREAAGGDLRELAFALTVVLLIHMNSGRPRHLLYTPIFWLKLLRGYFRPTAWRTLDRRTVGASS